MSSAVLTLAVANARYWTGVAPVARAQLARWERRARAIPDPALRATALAKLQTERFNAEAAATLATLAPRAQRARTAEAIVALQVAYDYLDGLTEQPAADPLRDGRRLSLAFTDALAGAGGRTPGGELAASLHTAARAAASPHTTAHARPAASPRQAGSPRRGATTSATTPQTTAATWPR